MPLALIVDDEPDIRDLLQITLNRMDLQTITAASVSEAFQLLNNRQFDLCLTDWRLPDGEGLAIVEQVQLTQADTPVAVITAHGSMDMAVQALKAGAFDFVSKPVDNEQLRNLVNQALKLAKQTRTAAGAEPVNNSNSQAPLNNAQANNAVQIAEQTAEQTLIGSSTAIQRLKQMIAKLSRSQAPVFINGESGSGKELVARLMHQQSARNDGPFIAVNCGAIPSELMESEFFGHKKGSFSGANADREGLFQAANGGTLFLDEVADLPLNMQVKLLRAIQEKAVRPIGGDREISVDIRLLSATHKNLVDLVERERFRQDLYYRINVIELAVPPLRERLEDLPELIEHMLKQQQQYNGQEYLLTTAAREKLNGYSFPGNVRELDNVLERAVALADGELIDADDLQLNMAAVLATDKDSRVEANAAKSTAAGQVDQAKTATDAVSTTHSDPSIEIGGDVPLEDQLLDLEKSAIERALQLAKYNKTAAAELLGMSFRSLRYKLKKLGID